MGYYIYKMIYVTGVLKKGDSMDPNSENIGLIQSAFLCHEEVLGLGPLVFNFERLEQRKFPDITKEGVYLRKLVNVKYIDF